MNRLTLSSVKSRAGIVMGVCPTDPRILGWLNDAQERLISRGKWIGTVVRYRFCIRSACITTPRQVETVEAWALCSTPGTLRDKWYEYAGTGGLRNEGSGCGTTMIDRGTSCAFNDISGLASKINVMASVTEVSGSRILLQGWDENANWIRTQDSGIWTDGEWVPITTSGARSTKTFTSLTGVQKPVTNGQVNLFEFPSAQAFNLQQLATYEPDETLPIYRRYQIPGLASTESSSCSDRAVTLMVKLRHVPVVRDEDWFILGNWAAFRLMLMAIAKEEKNLFEEAMQYENKAVAQLEYELSSYEGDGVVPVLRVADPAIFGGGSIEPVISGWI